MNIKKNLPATTAGHHMEIITLRGSRIRFTLSELKSAFFNQKFIIFIGLAGLLYFVFDVHGLSEKIGTMPRLLYWQWSAFITVFFYTAFVIVIALAAQKKKWIKAYLPIIPILSIWPTVALNRYVLFLTTGLPFPEPHIYIQQSLVSLTGVIVFEFLYFEFVQPVIEATYIRFSLDAASRNTEKFEISGRKYTVDSIMTIKSSDHYLEITKKNGRTETVYGKLSEVTAQNAPEWGLSPHRSYWVSKNSISSVAKEGRKVFLVLTDGTKIPVVQAKHNMVRLWLLEYLPVALK